VLRSDTSHKRLPGADKSGVIVWWLEANNRMALGPTASALFVKPDEFNATCNYSANSSVMHFADLSRRPGHWLSLTVRMSSPSGALLVHANCETQTGCHFRWRYRLDFVKHVFTKDLAWPQRPLLTYSAEESPNLVPQ